MFVADVDLLHPLLVVETEQTVDHVQHLALEGETAGEGTATQSPFSLLVTRLAVAAKVRLELTFYLRLGGLAARDLTDHSRHPHGDSLIFVSSAKFFRIQNPESNVVSGLGPEL